MSVNHKAGDRPQSMKCIVTAVFIFQVIIVLFYIRDRMSVRTEDLVSSKDLLGTTKSSRMWDSESNWTALSRSDQTELEPWRPSIARKRYRIGVVTITSEYKNRRFWNANKDYLKDILINRECYTSINNYDNLFYTTNAVENFTMPKGPKTPQGCRYVCTWPYGLNFTTRPMPGYWNKVWMMKNLLKHYDYLLWADADAFLSDMPKSIEWFIQQAKIHGVDAHVWVPQDQGGPGAVMFSNGVFLVKNSEYGQFMLDSWWDYGTGLKKTCKDRFFRTQQTGHDMNLDMPWMWNSLILLYDYYHNKTAPCLSVGCDKNTMGHCFRDYFLGLRYPLSHIPPDLGRVPGPIIFSKLLRGPPYDTGIMLQGNWGHFHDNEHVDAAFTVHSKREHKVYDRYKSTVHKLCVSNLGCKAKVARDAKTGELATWSRCDSADSPGDVDLVKKAMLRR